MAYPRLFKFHNCTCYKMAGSGFSLQVLLHAFRSSSLRLLCFNACSPGFSLQSLTHFSAVLFISSSYFFISKVKKYLNIINFTFFIHTQYQSTSFINQSAFYFISFINFTFFISTQYQTTSLINQSASFINQTAIIVFIAILKAIFQPFVYNKKPV
jgi:hypothetical protein